MSGAEILLLRHGQSEGNEGGRFGGQGPTPLTALGHAQAAATAEALGREGRLTAIHASDLIRAQQTAAPVAERLKLPITSTEALRERSAGLLTGLTFAEAEARYPQVFAALQRHDEAACAPEGETRAACRQRAGAYFDHVVSGLGDGDCVLLVSHAITIDLLLKHAFAMEAQPMRFRTDNCGLHRLRRVGTVWYLEAGNDRRHLAALTPPGK